RHKCKDMPGKRGIWGEGVEQPDEDNGVPTRWRHGLVVPCLLPGVISSPYFSSTPTLRGTACIHLPYRRHFLAGFYNPFCHFCNSLPCPISFSFFWARCLSDALVFLLSPFVSSPQCLIRINGTSIRLARSEERRVG